MSANTKKLTAKISQEELFEAELTLQEAVDLIEFCRQVFHHRISEIEIQLRKTMTRQAKLVLEQEAKELYEEYKKTLANIEECIEEIDSMYGSN